MQTLKTLTEVTRLLEKRPKKTTTYRVPANFLRKIPADSKVRLRTMTSAEIKELAA
jgi:hypothetical protein